MVYFDGAKLQAADFFDPDSKREDVYKKNTSIIGDRVRDVSLGASTYTLAFKGRTHPPVPAAQTKVDAPCTPWWKICAAFRQRLNICLNLSLFGTLQQLMMFANFRLQHVATSCSFFSRDTTHIDDVNY